MNPALFVQLSTAVVVARIFVRDARSKMVSPVMGPAGEGDPSSPGSPSSLRHPKAWCTTTLPAWPIFTTAPGSRCGGDGGLDQISDGCELPARGDDDRRRTGGVRAWVGWTVGGVPAGGGCCSGWPHDDSAATRSRAASRCGRGEMVGSPSVERLRHHRYDLHLRDTMPVSRTRLSCRGAPNADSTTAARGPSATPTESLLRTSVTTSRNRSRPLDSMTC